MTLSNGLLVIVGILALATLLAVVMIAKAPRPTGTLADSVSENGTVHSEKAGFGLHAAISLAVGLIVGVSLVWLGISVPGLIGIPAALSVGLALSAAIMTSAMLKRGTSSPGTVSEASLEPRHWWTFARPRSVTLLGALCALVVLTVVAYVSIGIAVPALAPTPAALWIYPAAIVGMVLVLAETTYFVLRKSADRPLSARPGTLTHDLVLRSTSARIISGMTGAVLFGYLAAIVSTIGGRLVTLGQIETIDGAPITALTVSGLALQVVSAGLAACSISSFAAAVSVSVSFTAVPKRRSVPVADRVAP